jgi:D-proline reductase (dithiol) PrdB
MGIDSYRFLDFASRQVMKASAARARPGVIPFMPLAKPLGDCTVALVSTAGIARNDDRPFDQDGERRNPWWGDPSFREVPLGTTEHDVRLYHLHIDPRFGEADLDVVLPMRRLEELAQQGIVGKPASRHYSIMGYILDPGVTILLPVRGTGCARARGERDSDGGAFADSGSDAGGRRAAAGGNQLSVRPSAGTAARRGRPARGAARDARAVACGDRAGHVRGASVRVARIAGAGAERVERAAVAADCRAHDEEAVAAGEPSERPRSPRSHGGVTTSRRRDGRTAVCQCRCLSGIPIRRTVSPSKSNSIMTAGSRPTTQPS